MNMETAAILAAKWWADQLRKMSPQDNGDITQSNLADFARNKMLELNPLTDEKIAIFQSELEAELLELIQKSDWREDQPNWGGALRTVCADYHPDIELQNAIKKANINEAVLPIKTTMRINPDGVKVSLGYRGKIETIKCENTKNREDVYTKIDWQEIE